MNNLSLIKQMVAEDKIEEAINTLSISNGKSTLGNSIVLVSSRYHEIRRLRNNNLINHGEYLIESAKIRYSILELCDEIAKSKNHYKEDETNELTKLLIFRANKINEIIDSIKFEKENKFSFFTSGVNRHKETIAKSKKLFNILHQKHIDALEKGNLILANEIALEIHVLLFRLSHLDISNYMLAYNAPPMLGRHLSKLYLDNPTREPFNKIWSYIESDLVFKSDEFNSEIFNFRRERIEELLEFIK